MTPPEARTGGLEQSSPALRYCNILYQQRYLVLLACVLLTVIAGAGMFRLRLASNYEIYFDRSNPRLKALDALHNVFSRNDNILFVLVPASHRVFSPGTLAAVIDLTRAAWQLPFAARVDSISNFQHITSTADGVVIADMIPDDQALSPAKARGYESVALRESALVGRLLSPAADVTGINVRLEINGDTRLAVSQAARAARTLAARIHSRYPRIEVRLTGNAMLNAAFPKAGIYDLTHLTPFMYLMILLSLMVLLRSVLASLAAFCAVASACVIAMGLAGWDSLVLSSASVVAPTIIGTVAIADSVHLLTGFLRGLGRYENRVDAFGYSLQMNFKPVALTSLTTAIGFLSLNFSDAPPFRDLGNITAIGVVAAFVLTLVLLPTLLFIFPRPRRWSHGREPWLNVAGYAEWILRHSRAAFWSSLLVVMVVSAGIGHVQLNDAFVEYFDKRVAFRRDTDFTMQHLTGIYQLEYAVNSGSEHGVMDPGYLRQLDAFGVWLKRQPEVMHVNIITEVLKRLNQHLGDGRYALPASRQLAAQYLLLYEMSVPYGLDLNARLSVDRSSSRVTVTLKNLDNLRLRNFESRADAWLKANTEPVMQAPAVGASIMFAYIAEHNIKATLEGAAVAIAIIALILLLVFRNTAVALLSLIPNLVPALTAFGLWALLVGQMGVALVIVATMSLGIVVDDTIHLVANYVHARRHLAKTAEDAIRYAFRVAGTALVSTSVILALGFAVLTLSSFEVNHGMGELTILVIVCALAADFLMLPGLLIFASRRGWI